VRRVTRATFAAFALAVSVAVALAACGVPGDDEPGLVPEGEIPAALRADGDGPSVIGAGRRVDVWFLRDDGLVSRQRRIPEPAAPDAVVEQLLAGPTVGEQADGLRSAIPDPEAVTEVSVARGVASVTLSSTFADIPANDQRSAVAQLVLTLTDRPGIGRVRFLVADEAVSVPLPNGEQTDEAVSREDFEELVRPAG
jgi:spore germination protein GerM